MERLPYEIQLEIFSKLPKTDRFTSLFVSKAWNNAAKTCVFNDITISYDKEKLTRAMTYFEENANLATQVINMNIAQCANIYRYLSRLPQLFPNIKRFTVDLNDRKINLDLQTEPTPGTWKKLEYIETDEGYCNTTYSILEQILSGYCPNVKLVKLTFGNFDEPAITIQNNYRRIIDLLKNAPQLLKLEIRDLHCTLNDLETLHQNTPNLHTLILSNDTEFALSETPVQIVGIRYLYHLEIMLFETILHEAGPSLILNLFDYISKKYYGLTFFSLTYNLEYCDKDSLGLVFSELDETPIEEKLLPLFARCPTLTHYDQIFCPFTSAIAREIDRWGIKLSTLVIYTTEHTSSDQFEALFNSQQPQYIKYLTIYELGERDEFLTAWPTRQLSQMINLKELKLEGSLEPINFTEITTFLKYLPQLEVFEVRNTMNTLPFMDSGLPTLALRSLWIEALTISWASHFEVINATINTVLSKSPQLESFFLIADIKSNNKKENTKPLTISLDFRAHKNLHRIDTLVRQGEQKERYYLESPRMTGYFYDVHEVGERLVKTEPFQPDEYYTSILLSHPTNLNGITFT